MQKATAGPRKRAGFRMLATLLMAVALIGCQAPRQALQELAISYDQRLEILPSQPFPLASSIPISHFTASRIRVYLEGDGHAWATATQPSLDPSPRKLLVARLAFSDPMPSLYLARPCQFVSVPDCRFELWTDRRFAPEILESLDHALDIIKARHDNRDFELIGYSGGAALALLLAVHRDDIAQVQTLAGNLNPRQWVAFHQLSALSGSLEPLDFRDRLARIPQRHLAGADDRIVPPVLMQRYLDALGEADCLESLVLADVSHANGWQQAWPVWRDRPIACMD